MSKRWRLRPHDRDRVARLQHATGLPAVLVQLLVCRGIDDPSAAVTFVDPKLAALRDPDELPGCQAAVDRIAAAVDAGEPITIYGDYDVDGVAATSLLWLCLRLLGANVNYYVPHRIDEGYGLNEDAIAQLAAQGTRLLVTVDCGITAISQCETARRLGLEVIVTDHHQPGPELPGAAAMVHPGLPGGGYPFTGLSGAGVAFKVAWSLCRRMSRAPRVTQPLRDCLLQATAIAALGTIADVVPLVDENRILVRHGLHSLRERPTLGLQTLMRVAQLDRKPQLSAEDVAFSIAPRLNAAGRLGQAQLAIELLTTDCPKRAQSLAEYINELNASRQGLERSIYLRAHKQAHEQFDPQRDPAFVLADRGWHPGVIGIVAGRVAEKFHRPVVLISLDELGVKPAVGSARGIPGFNLHQALSACAHHLISFGGHQAAAGLKIEEARLSEFRDEFCRHAAENLVETDRVAQLWIDAEAPLSAFNLQTVQQIERLAPFGCGNPRPLLCASTVRLAEPPRRVGNGDRHLAMKVVQHGTSMRAIAFGAGDREPELADLDRPLSIAFHPTISDYAGVRRVELQIADWQFEEQASAACPPPRATGDSSA